MRWKPEGWKPKRAGFYWYEDSRNNPREITVVELYKNTIGKKAEYVFLFPGTECELRPAELEGRFSSIPKPREEKVDDTPPWVLYRDPKGSDTSRDVQDNSMVGVALDLEKKILDKLPTIAINSYGWGRFKKEVKALMQDGLNASNLNDVFDYYENHYARLQGWTSITLKIGSMQSLGKALGAWKARTGELTKPKPAVRLWEE